MPHEGRVYLGLFGQQFDPTALQIGIQPTKVMVKADPRPKHSAWIYSSEKVVADFIDVYAVSAALIATLKPHEHAIVTAIREHQLKACLEVVLTISDDESLSTPAIGFDSEVIGFMHRIGGTIDVDTYRAAN